MKEVRGREGGVLRNSAREETKFIVEVKRAALFFGINSALINKGLEGR